MTRLISYFPVVVLITGCTSGIGVETARAMASTGAKVYITARRKEVGQAVADKITRESGHEFEVIELSLDSFAVCHVDLFTFTNVRTTANLALGPTVGPMGRVALGGRNWEAFSVDLM